MNRILKAYISDLKRKMKARDRELDELAEQAKRVASTHNEQMAPILVKIGRELSSHFDQSQKTAYRIAAEMDLPQSAYSRMKKGEYMFGEDALAKLEAWAEKA